MPTCILEEDGKGSSPSSRSGCWGADSGGGGGARPSGVAVGGWWPPVPGGDPSRPVGSREPVGDGGSGEGPSSGREAHEPVRQSDGLVKDAPGRSPTSHSPPGSLSWSPWVASNGSPSQPCFIGRAFSERPGTTSMLWRPRAAGMSRSSTRSSQAFSSGGSSRLSASVSCSCNASIAREAHSRSASPPRSGSTRSAMPTMAFCMDWMSSSRCPGRSATRAAVLSSSNSSCAQRAPGSQRAASHSAKH